MNSSRISEQAAFTDTGEPVPAPDYPGEYHEHQAQTVTVRFSVELGNTQVSIARILPLGHDTTTTLEHIEQLITLPGMEMARTLIKNHFLALTYCLTQITTEEDNRGI